MALMRGSSRRSYREHVVVSRRFRSRPRRCSRVSTSASAQQVTSGDAPTLRNWSGWSRTSSGWLTNRPADRELAAAASGDARVGRAGSGTGKAARAQPESRQANPARVPPGRDGRRLPGSFRIPDGDAMKIGGMVRQLGHDLRPADGVRPVHHFRYSRRRSHRAVRQTRRFDGDSEPVQSDFRTPTGAM